ncbi:transcriptional regulator [Streptomyces sp. NPDC046985]|uniref:transcriptional regulator n=1 Tax=Streptomyces sp. NPDC046985 TaxID=3155377 RepID=UPI0033DE83E7
MTVVHTPAPPPPRLPVRDRAAAADRAWGGLSPMLTRLAAERASGVLVRERGALYLAEGRVVHAESPLAPSLDALLTAHGTLTADVWRDALSRADDRRGAAHLLLADGRLTEGALQLCHLGALYDAAYFALAPSSAPGRFRYGVAHRLGPILPVPVAALERETLRRRDLLDRIWPHAGPDGAPLVRTHASAAPKLTSRQRRLLDRVDGARTATDLAHELGRQAFHTLVDVRRLASAGLIAPRPAPAPPQPAPPDPGADPAAGAAERLARTTDPHITLLKRLRDALEAL